MTLPLDGLKVLDMTWSVAGPTNGRVLADFGAQVVRVETSTRIDLARYIEPFVGGVVDPERNAIFGNYNAGKLGIAVNMKTDGGLQVLRDLIAWADVYIESFTPGVVDRLGLGYHDARALNPSIIMMSTSLMGGTGPLSRVGGYGNIGAALSGFQHLVGWPDKTPFGPFGPYTDAVSPRFSMPLLLGALDHRERTGNGSHIDVSQVEGAIELLAPEIAHYSLTGEIATRAGNHHRQMAPHGVFLCRRDPDAESTWVAIAVQDDEAWSRLVALMGHPPELEGRGLEELGERLVHRIELNQLVQQWVASQTATEIEEALQSHQIAAHVALSSADAAQDPQLRAQAHFVELDHQVAERTVVEGPRYRLSSTPGVVTGPSPMLGEHTEFVLRDLLGYDDQALERLTAQDALR